MRLTLFLPLGYSIFAEGFTNLLPRRQLLHPPSICMRKVSILCLTTKERGENVDTIVENSSISLNEEVNSPKEDNKIFLSETYGLVQASIIGIMAGGSVGVFKLLIDALRRLTYGSPLLDKAPSFILLPLIPAAGGAIVGLLSLYGTFPPGLKGTIASIDELDGSKIQNFDQRIFGFLRKTLAAICTLGTGCSLGPEGTAVEVGMAIGTTVIGFPFQGKAREKINRSRLLLVCGAAAGVSAGFNAPIAGVFFALEIVQAAFRSTLGEEENIATATSSNISAILISSVLSALTAKTILGDHSVFELSDYTLRSPLAELPLYLLLGAVSGIVAFTFSQSAKISKDIFDGEQGPQSFRQFMKQVPSPVKPIIGGLFCGIVGLAFPQILFFGYETLNGLLANSSLPTGLLLVLLGVKIICTAVSVGSGLVGGTFAPSLFLGGMVGASFHNAMAWLFSQLLFPGASLLQFLPPLELADVPAYAMVGSASVLAALFRAPLTASLLLFELTRDYDVILPLMASAGVGSLVSDIIEQRYEER